MLSYLNVMITHITFKSKIFKSKFDFVNDMTGRVKNSNGKANVNSQKDEFFMVHFRWKIQSDDSSDSLLELPDK